MTRLYAAVLLVPVVFLSFMIAKARTSNKSKSSKRVSTQSATVAVNVTSPLTSLSAEQTKWVESSLRAMSLEEKVGQLLFTTYHGSFTPNDSDAFASMIHDINDLHVGGFITITHGSPLG